MTEKQPRSPEMFRISPRVGLLLILLVSLAAVSWAVASVYQLVHYTLGMEIAQVVVAFLVILVLRLVFVGVRVGFNTKRALRKRQDHALRIYYLFERSRTFQEFWLYLGLQGQTERLAAEKKPVVVEQTVGLREPQNSSTALVSKHQGPGVEEEISWIVDLEEEITKRGRPPDHSINRWAKVVAAWERRDLWRDPITLDEFLCREFGECADGSPRVSRGTFYTWRKKVHHAARRGQGTEKPSESMPEVQS